MSVLPGWAGAALAGLACVCACARPAEPAATLPPASNGAQAAEPIPEPIVDRDPASALVIAADDGFVLVRPDVLRRHPVGARIGPILATWPGWRATLDAIADDPIADLDWIDVVGPTDPRRQRMLAGVSSRGGDPAIDGRLIALQARSAEPARRHIDGAMPAAAAPLDGSLRVVFRSQSLVVAAVPAALGPAFSHALAHARVHPPATEPDEAILLDVPRPNERVRQVPPQITHLRGRVLSLANGGADGAVVGQCDTPADATNAADALRQLIASHNGPIARMLLHGLLDAVAIATREAVVTIHVPATRDQLEMLLVLASATGGLRAP